jgi:hypothetical protein
VHENLLLTFKEMKKGELYLVRQLPDYYGATEYETNLMECTGLFFKKGKKMVEYKMVLNLCLVPGDRFENCGTTFEESEFSRSKFKRIPSDFFTHFSKYEKTVNLRFFSDDAAKDFMF